MKLASAVRRRFSRRHAATPANLDFDGRVPIPFSVFPSTYRNEAPVPVKATKTEQVRVEAEVKLASQQPAQSVDGREGHEGRQQLCDLPSSQEERIFAGTAVGANTTPDQVEQQDHIVQESHYQRESTKKPNGQRYQQPYRRYADAQIDVQDRVYDRDFNNLTGPTAETTSDSRLDITERELRHSSRPIVGSATFVAAQRTHHQSSAQYPTQQQAPFFPQEERPVAPQSFGPISNNLPTFSGSYSEFAPASKQVEFASSTERRSANFDQPSVAPASYSRTPSKSMGYYDDDGNYHSFRRGLHRAADKVIHPFEHHDRKHHPERVNQERDSVIFKQREVLTSSSTTNIPRSSVSSVSAPFAGTSSFSAPQASSSVQKSSSSSKMPANSISIPCHHIRIGDLLVLQGRPCQVIRITTSSQTGQHRYLGVDLFTKQLHEESSFISNPSPSVVVQNMYGPVFKQYRVLDIREDSRIVAMTETGEIKQGLTVLDQNNLFSRISESFDSGRGSIRVLVINDNGQELAVDYKIVHGSRL